jgi:hypothetical protein
MVSESRVTILVKASPQPSKKHQETVCCAGLQEDGTWKRLFPIRFRRLSGDQAFKRWDIVHFSYSNPSDPRKESCRVHEESLVVSGRVKRDSEKTALIERALLSSEKEAMELGHSLAVIRPTDVQFKWKKLTPSEIENDRKKFADQAAQLSLLDNEIASYEPCPYKFTMKYHDAGGRHTKTCADWETSAAFFNLRKSLAEQDVLKHLEHTYCSDYVQKGLVFALGNMMKKPKTWQLLGIFPAAQSEQLNLF